MSSLPHVSDTFDASAWAEVPGFPFTDITYHRATAAGPAGGVVRIAFDRFAGTTVYHCHVLDHEDLGMMGTIRAV